MSISLPLVVGLLAAVGEPAPAHESKLVRLRPPAVPLVVHDPYFSIWSRTDNLADGDTVHWTRKPHRLSSLARIDGRTFRLMGLRPGKVPTLPQTNLEVLPTRTIYTFEGEGVRLALTFMTPALPEDLEVLARPVTYLTWTAQSLDGREREIWVTLTVSGEIAANLPTQGVASRWEHIGELTAVGVGCKDQPVLEKKGDDLRIDWGHLYAAFHGSEFSPISLGALRGGRPRVVQEVPGSQPSADDPVPAGDFEVTIGSRMSPVGRREVARTVMLAYDDEFSIQYMHTNLRPYWRREGDDAAVLLKKAAADYEGLKKRCERFDDELMADLRETGGEKYARIAALAYRQCFAAGKFVADSNGQPLQFCKENASNGCIGTADVFYPMAPQFLLFGATLTKSFLVPFMNYAASERWQLPFAPHDLGTYPQANGQAYGSADSEENQMPVEESGNLLILMAAVAKMEGHAEFAGFWWLTLEKWAAYLKAKGYDPENQLCTDDFMGHLAHNVNLSAKAIIGLGAFGKLCEMRGDKAKAAEYLELARTFARQWAEEADDGDHFRLAFDRPGTWSQKYNLIWDRILELGLFPPEIGRKEVAFYRTVQNEYGLPLDSRSTLTKLDWIVWSATLSRDRADVEALIEPIYRFLNETSDRVPMTDCYWTQDGRNRHFMARPVVGAVFAPLLYDKALWEKWSGREKTKAANWAPIPSPSKGRTPCTRHGP